MKIFLNSCLFDFHQIENIRVINIKDQFQDWFRKTFPDIKLNCFPLDDWTLETATAFIFQQYLDTTLSKSEDWNIGLFLELYPDELDGFFHRGTFVLSLPKPNRYRTMHNEYVILECMVLNKIVGVFQNSLTRKDTENYLKTYYNIHH